MRVSCRLICCIRCAYLFVEGANKTIALSLHFLEGGIRPIHHRFGGPCIILILDDRMLLEPRAHRCETVSGKLDGPWWLVVADLTQRTWLQ